MDLTSLSETTRKAVIFAILGIIAFIIIRIAFGIVVGIIGGLTPEKAPVADRAFGTLEPIKFSSPAISSGDFTYSLETVDSALPQFSNILPVYQALQPASLFLGLEQAKLKAKNFGFNSQPTQLTDKIYQWNNPELPGYVFIYDVVNGDYRLKLEPKANPQALTGRVTVDTAQAQKQALDYLRNKASLLPLFEGGDIKVQFLKITADQTTRVSAANEANAYRVDIFPVDFDKDYPIKTQSLDNSPLNITFLASAEQRLPYEVNFKYVEINKDKKATYDIKSSQTAWEDLNKGSAIVIKTPKPNGKVAINTIYLAYFLEDKTQILKPVYVFEGNLDVGSSAPDFIAVLPAIASEDVAQ